ncbi:adaptor protein complex AP-2 [Salpingoeca rosetta]|uniref:AP-2 complex subunit alpha n=1 Tax=Salpingoeca rosetta (strain ATCC 50818 / BSB-021) TaxID=946362 RepID=F2UJZ7_SALR5|nr:adaptor protein complex AP-2 [Salpingoeca rosetta]EGD77446.1 adaptor protein complex AP-2 [Salpingoeca rosetta]|eukprot:XP_004990334.1 adaptor protein complex AP-2 [Salpingoeca rosetta]
MGKEDMRGLSHFIADIRASKSKEAELKRINKELANIRAKFGDKKGLTGYQKKKYVCKLIFMFLLGHEVEFGHMEAVNLLSSLHYSEKQMGYLFASVMLNEQHDLMRLVIQAIKTDLSSRNELNVSLALHCISNIGGKETASEVATLVQRLLVADESPNTVKKKAALAMLRLFREAPEQVAIAEYTPRVIQLLTSPDTGVVTSTASLLTALASANPDEYRSCVAVAINKLHRIVLARSEQEDYIYYSVPAPWLTVKLLRLLQLFPFPGQPTCCSRHVYVCVCVCLSVCLPVCDGRPTRVRIQYFNVNHACMFEAMNLIAHYDNNADLQIKACTLLGDFLIHKETNMRFLALESLSVMATTEYSHEAVKRHKSSVIRALKHESDPTVQRRAADVLYALCDSEAVERVVDELLNFLDHADYSVREELVLKIAILAERFVKDYSWYVDVMLRLIRRAGDHVAPEVWYRVIQVIVNRQDVQDYAAKTCFEALLDPAVHEAMVNVGGYVLGEFGHLIANDPNSSPVKQLEVIQMHYPMVSASTRALLLSTYVKLANLFPEIKSHVLQVLKTSHFLKNADAELQQRANEYVHLLQTSNTDVVPAVLEEMPPFSDAQTTLLQRLETKRTTVTEKTGTLAARKRQEGKKIELGEVSAAAHSAVPAKSETTVINNDPFFDKFTLVNDGVLYENPVLQIGVKSEFHGNLGRLTVFYGNRGDAPMTGVTTRAFVPNAPDALSIDARPIDATIPPGVQLQQQINVECVTYFSDAPVLEVSLKYQGRAVVLALKLPVMLNKFIEPLTAPMDAPTFFKKWNQLGGPPREVRQIIKAKEPIVLDQLHEKVVSFGLPTMPDIDPKPQNLVCAGIIHTTNAQIGTLLRVEPNVEAQMIRFTVRASVDAASVIVSNLLVSNF